LTDTAQTWASALRDVTGQQLADGLRACLDRQDTWPPTLPEFKQLCDGKISEINEFGMNYIPEYHREQKTPLTKRLSSDARKEKRENQLAEHMPKLREILK